MSIHISDNQIEKLRCDFNIEINIFDNPRAYVHRSQNILQYSKDVPNGIVFNLSGLGPHQVNSIIQIDFMYSLRVQHELDSIYVKINTEDLDNHKSYNFYVGPTYNRTNDGHTFWYDVNLLEISDWRSPRQFLCRLLDEAFTTYINQHVLGPKTTIHIY